jgi:hypothetical protein
MILVAHSKEIQTKDFRVKWPPQLGIAVRIGGIPQTEMIELG